MYEITLKITFDFIFYPYLVQKNDYLFESFYFLQKNGMDAYY